MLPQFGFIVAQAGADYYSTLPNGTPPPPAVPPPPPAAATAAAGAGAAATPPPPAPPAQSNGHSSLAPLLSNKPFGFANGLGPSHSNNYNNVPFYSRQPSPSAQAMQPILPPPSFLYNNKPKEIIAPPAKSSIMEKNDPWYHRPMKSPPLPPTPVQQQKREPSPYYNTVEEEHQDQKNNTATVRQEYNDLMTWMDNEFWEQADEIYQEKLLDLQTELMHLQKGTHSAFKEMINDYEEKREKTISDAECFMNYQISFIEQYFDQDLNTLEDEYENERKQIQDTLVTLIEDKRKQIKDDREENQDEDTSQLNRTKRTLRKRTADTSSPSRTEPLSKRKSVRPSTLHNIHNITPLEEEELESEYIAMKKLISTQNSTTTSNSSKLFSR